ncbi:MAG: hypothetical protein KAW09_05510 [Thermoplasmata archaeon]|nr:hypothetical protein [Thermoplasmata archaeon]
MRKMRPSMKDLNPKVVAYISASFDETAQTTVEWIIAMASKLGYDPVWLGSRVSARPVKEKIKEAIRRCEAFIQIWTQDVMGTSREAGTMKEEYVWFDDMHPGAPIAVFKEKGLDLSGQIKHEVEICDFSSDNLASWAPAMVEYLVDLRERSLRSRKTARDPEEIKVGVLHGTERWGQCPSKYCNFGPDDWMSWFATRNFHVEKISVEDVEAGKADKFDAIVNPFGEYYPESDPSDERTLDALHGYMEKGGTLVLTGGWPFYYAWTPSGTHRRPSRFKDAFGVDVNGEQLWEDYERVEQPDWSSLEYGEVYHKGGDIKAHIWRPLKTKYGSVEKVLLCAQRDGVVIGAIPVGEGKLITTGMALYDTEEFDKLAAFLYSYLARRH